LTQWLTYSLIEVFEKVLEWRVDGVEDMTGLPEYRNGEIGCSQREGRHQLTGILGGLLVDLGVLTLKPNALPIDPKSGLPCAEPSHPAIVEWRAMTVMEL
jgi:Protein of unknown function (DUF1688)